jgi:hypothetical protein
MENTAVLRNHSGTVQPTGWVQAWAFWSFHAGLSGRRLAMMRART